ncbi:MAG: hypothetical protein PHV23_03415 [Candidatus Gracilibacteria bacterium]|nr:hypothetical protein [Candidatus Gracilibacteria bacterium]
MYRNILTLVISFVIFGANVYADTGVSTVSWSNSIVDCPSTLSHGITHLGVPNGNTTSIASVGSLGCTTHSYYSSSNHIIGFTYNNGGITACPVGERAVSWDGISTITCQQYDDIPPVAVDITSSITNGDYFRASSSVPISVVGLSAGGSPITLLQGQFENTTNPASLNSVKSSTSDNNPGTLNVLETNEDISMVDGSDITTNNYRPYSYNITNICDEAGNCLANPASFTYNVYAGYINSSLSSVAGAFNFVGQVADGSTKSLTYTLKDDYGNKIIPVYRSNGTTLQRSIEFILNYNNSLYLNQYNKLGSGVDISGVDNPALVASTIGTNVNKNVTITDKNNNDGDYLQKFNIYSPTYSSSASDGRQFVNGNFNINSINVQLSDKIPSDTIQSTSIDFQFKPLYVTNITGSVRDNGFIVGSTQTGVLNVTSAGTKNVYIEYGYYDPLFPEPHLSHPKIDLNYKKTAAASWDISAEGYTNPYSSLSLFGTSTSNILTKLVQSGSLNTAEQNTYFATHISTLVAPGKTAVYSSDILGMNRYAGTNTGDNTSQRGVKINGLTHSNDQVDIVTGQSTSDISLLGNLEKSYFQRDVRKNAYSLVKEVTPINGSKIVSNVNQTSPGVKLGDVLYFGGLDGENVEINLSGKYTGVKTILVEGGNVYIKGNILANNKSTDILGIVALKNDSTGNGGNIYINPNVLEIDAVLYSDRAVASADDTTILNSTDLSRAISPDNGGTYEYLSKQLYIYGTVFSNNTIGGSVQSPYKCPFYITSCTLDISQKYDMNYLRRDYITKYLGTYEDYPVIINYNSLIQLTPPKLFEKTQ